LVVDDEPDAALFILKALSKLGIPSTWFTGEVDQLPAEQFRGVRLAVLDMDLLPSSAEEHAKLDFLELVMGKLLGADNGPYGILAWTANAGLLESFKIRLFASDLIPSPMYILGLEKPQLSPRSNQHDDPVSIADKSSAGSSQKDQGAQMSEAAREGPQPAPDDMPAPADRNTHPVETVSSTEMKQRASADSPLSDLAADTRPLDREQERYTFDAATEEIRKRLLELKTMNVLQSWEGAAMSSAAEVVNSLFALAKDQVNSAIMIPPGKEAEFFSDDKNRARWTDQMDKELLVILRALSEAGAGNISLDEVRALEALFGALNPLHADRLERASENLIANVKDHSGIASTVVPKLSNVQAAKINSAIQLCPEFDGGAGAIYHLAGGDPLFHYLPTAEAVVKDICNLPKRNSGETEDDYEARLSQLVTELAGGVQLVFIEVNPICDYSQQNIRQTRLLAAVVVPEDRLGLFKKSRQEALGSIYRFGPVYLDDTQAVAEVGTHHLIASSLHTATLPPTMAAGLKPFMRMRLQALVRLMAWLGYQSSRPGMLFINA
jgi:hypothetical protein